MILKLRQITVNTLLEETPYCWDNQVR